MERDVLDPDEVRQQIESLTKVDLARLRKAGRIKAFGLGCEADDLIGRAVELAMTGKRQCPRGTDFVVFLYNALRSIASAMRASPANAEPIASLDATGTDGRPVVMIASPELDAEALSLRAEDTAQRIKALEELFADDDDALLMIWADLEETPKEEVKMQHNLDDKAYATIRRRIRRAIDRRFPNGWST
ncbi:hypothetical protein [Sphingobium sp. CR28]|uniref:hypothetical protein n=1 Tax=Sphingobium sp. CR28 TaxID=3400272 RepID=UPI003FED84DD